MPLMTTTSVPRKAVRLSRSSIDSMAGTKSPIASKLVPKIMSAAKRTKVSLTGESKE